MMNVVCSFKWLQQVLCWLSYILPQSILITPTTTHTPLTHTVCYPGALLLLWHTPVPRRVMLLSSHLLSRESFWACWQGNPAQHSIDTPTLPIWLDTSSTLALLLQTPSLLWLYFTTHEFALSLSPYTVVSVLLVYLFLLFPKTELIQDFHSWLADMKLEFKDCSNQSGDLAILGAKLQRLKVLCIILLY